MGQRHWIRGLTRLFFLMALLACAAAVAADRRPGDGGLQPHRRRRQPAHRGGLDPRLRRDRAGPAGDARAAQPRGPASSSTPASSRTSTVMPEAGRLVITVGGEPDDQPDRLRGQRQPRRRGAGRGDPAPPAARLLGAGGGGGRPADHRGLPGRRALRRHGEPGHHPPVGEPRRPGLRDLRGPQDRGAADQLQRQPGLLRPPAAAGDRDQPDQLAELRSSAATPTTPTSSSSTASSCASSTSSAATSTCRCCPRPPRWSASAPASSSSFTISEGQRYNFGTGLGQLADPRPQRRRLPAAAGAGGRTGASTTSSWSTGWSSA